MEGGVGLDVELGLVPLPVAHGRGAAGVEENVRPGRAAGRLHVEDAGRDRRVVHVLPVAGADLVAAHPWVDRGPQHRVVAVRAEVAKADSPRDHQASPPHELQQRLLHQLPEGRELRRLLVHLGPPRPLRGISQHLLVLLLPVEEAAVQLLGQQLRVLAQGLLAESRELAHGEVGQPLQEAVGEAGPEVRVYEVRREEHALPEARHGGVQPLQPSRVELRVAGLDITAPVLTPRAARPVQQLQGQVGHPLQGPLCHLRRRSLPRRRARSRHPLVQQNVALPEPPPDLARLPPVEAARGGVQRQGVVEAVLFADAGARLHAQLGQGQHHLPRVHDDVRQVRGEVEGAEHLLHRGLPQVVVLRKAAALPLLPQCLEVERLGVDEVVDRAPLPLFRNPANGFW
mmetsp:Transcript_94053/g.266091  ORF Transcript_94053/g.266091 Transcript_94053/m.266091 type:complete len:400 (+) Transcript_94053:200-1399(+)